MHKKIFVQKKILCNLYKKNFCAKIFFVHFAEKNCAKCTKKIFVHFAQFWDKNTPKICANCLLTKPDDCSIMEKRARSMAGAPLKNVQL